MKALLPTLSVSSKRITWLSEQMNEKSKLTTLDETIDAARTVAARYRELTGKPLGITGEIGEVLTAKLLNLKLAEARQAGYDAIGSDGRLVQIKSRCILADSKPSQRVGGIRLDHKWDSVALILMDQAFEPIEIYEATRAEVEKALKSPGSKARNDRGALAVSKFKAIGELRWARENKLQD